MNDREQFINEIAKGNVSDEAVIKYCKEAIQNEADLQGFVVDLEKASRNNAYRQQGYLSNAVEAICKYLGVSSVFEIQEVNLKEIYETALKRSGYTDKEKEQQALLHKAQTQPEPQPIRKATNADEVLKHFELNKHFEAIALDKTKTASTLEELLERACNEPVADGVVITRKAYAKRLKESLVDWITADGNRALYKYCLKKSSFKNIAPDAKRLADAIEDRAVEWLASVKEASTINSLPEELQSNKAQMLLQNAKGCGLIEVSNGQYVWKENKQLLAYFAFKASDYLELTKQQDQNGNVITCWKPFELLFNVGDLRGAKANWMRINTKFEPTGYEKVDVLFNN